MVCRLLNAINAAAACVYAKVLDIMVSKILNWFDIDLAPLGYTIKLIFKGRPSALRIITAILHSVVDKHQVCVERFFHR